jgi:hypothetical protein
MLNKLVCLPLSIKVNQTAIHENNLLFAVGLRSIEK